MKNLFYNRKLSSKLVGFICIASILLTFSACKKNEEANIYLHNKKDATQTAFADEEKTAGFTFTSKSNWMATVKEAANPKNNDVSWMKLIHNEKETYYSNAGTFKMGISLEPNYSGKTRAAIIEIVSNNEKIIITVSQSGKTKEGEDPEPKPVVIDLSNAIWGEHDIATLKIFSGSLFDSWEEEHLLVSTEVAQTGYVITLPNPEAVSAPLWSFPFTIVSDPNAKHISIGLGPVPCRSDGRILGGFELITGNQWGARYIYVDRDCSLVGTIETSLPIQANCYFKKGWNIYYCYWTSAEEIWTTENPYCDHLYWRLWLYNIKKT